MPKKLKTKICIPTLLKVKVTQKHIDAGKSDLRGQFCPIALALKDAGYKGVEVTDFISFKFGKYNPNYYSKKANTFVKYFDNGYDVKPFEFVAELELGEKF